MGLRIPRATDGSGYPGVQAVAPERGIAADSGVDGGARRHRTGARIFGSCV